MLQHEPHGNRRLRNSCDLCIQSKTRCNKEKPSCRRCVRRGQPCVYSVARRPGRPRKGSQATDGGEGVNNQTGHPQQQGIPNRTMSTPACMCQQRPSTFLGLDQNDFDFVLTDAAITDRTEEIIGAPRLDFGLHTRSTFESGLLRNERIDSIGSSSSYPFDVFLGETAESPTSHYAFTSDGRTRQDSSNSMVASPVNTQPLPTNSASLRANMEQERNAQRPNGRSDGTILFGFSDIERAFSEGSTFLELDSMIRYILENRKSDSETDLHPVNHHRDSCLCFCSTATNKLIILVSHLALNRKSGLLPLDIAFFFEKFIYEIHESVFKCLVCRTKSLHSRAFLCISTEWVIETLKDVIQSISSRRRARDESCIGVDSVVDSSIIRVGQRDLGGHLQGACTRSLIKHRLSRLILTIDKMRKHENEWRGAALLQTVRIMMHEIHHKIESILGMMEL